METNFFIAQKIYTGIIINRRMINEMKVPTLLLMITSNRREAFIICIFALQIKFILIPFEMTVEVKAVSSHFS